VKYRTIVADPPWSYREKFSRKNGLQGSRNPDMHYEVMPLCAIRALPVRDLSDERAHLYLWTTNSFMVEAHDIATAWGFVVRSILTWVKPGVGLGHYFRNNTEHVLFGVRGSLPVRQKNLPTAFFGPKGRHSAKPEAFTDMVEQASPGPYVELFARRHRIGWDVFGNESANTASLEVPA
jgi:N6-adenosine-specific RNA methylase IME4